MQLSADVVSKSDDNDDEIGQTSISADINASGNELLREEEIDELLMHKKRVKTFDRIGPPIDAKSLENLSPKHSNILPSVSISETCSGSAGFARNEIRSEKSRIFKNETSRDDGQLVVEVEERILMEKNYTGSSSDEEESNEPAEQRLLGVPGKKKKKKGRTVPISVNPIYFVAILLFVFLGLFFWKKTWSKRTVSNFQLLKNNGTAPFAPTTILISLDGFRADFLDKGITPRLGSMVKEGVSPPYMRPSFPSVTFPNHYTLVTGLYPESHGIVGNRFWDKELKEEFIHTGPSALDPKWWGGEPIWVTAEKQGMKTAIHMWPGSEADIMDVKPTYLDNYDGKLPLSQKADRIMELLDMPGYVNDDTTLTRPQLIAAYVPNVDADCHLYGPESNEVLATIHEVDSMLEKVFVGLEKRNLTNIVNVVIVSDHGMATTDVSRMIQLEDLIDLDQVEHIDGWPLYGLHPKGEINEMYGRLSTLAEENGNFKVYLKDSNMPERFHFSNNHRIAPLWVVPNTGWAIATKKEFDVKESIQRGIQYHPRGLHGYDNEHPLMRAIFIAKGPFFKQVPNSILEPFQNIEVYNIICDTLGLEPLPNNGTMRLPLVPTHQNGSEDNKSMKFNPELVSASMTLTQSIPSSEMPTSSGSMSSSTEIPKISATELHETAAVPEASKSPEIDTSWMSEKQKELLEWLRANADDMKSWLKDIAAGN
ncbi:ectonucleotide pyrophosphatase/phosphodiesterase family member [Blumeria hordei DH14]|uniref:Ectonucleotide pyrophosphatase/phosphodiesterase family member n=1 Tax=Blumeria graminis f. sp. hordei (strain DH14) TaxID=546991 RepID=N1JAL2_BLUG1|nr:ectonucleotide pyrophosphatase/phosphodiesterase family member [Blumeria hordei DH14]